MSLKSLIQVVIILIIIIILGSVYFNYFSNYNELSLQEQEDETVELKVETEIPKEEAKVETEIPKEEAKVETEIPKEEAKVETEIPKEEAKVETEIPKEEAKVETEIPKEEAKVETEIPKEEAKVKKPKIANLVKDVEYLTTDENGNKYKILAKSGRTNSDNKNVLDLDNVRGFITSDKRSTIYIVSDFAEYNSSELNSNFYQNVVINYEDKEITCDNFEIDMKTNIAVAYNNVVVTDPKSIMKAGIITLDIETKVININPDNKKNKVTVTTN